MGKHNKLFWGQPNYWATAAYNEAVYQMYRQQIFELALSRFKWVGLPTTVDQRYLEWTLLTQGVATIAYPKSQPGVFYGTQMAYNSPPNVYDNPTKWQSIGNNGWRFNVTPANGVVVWDNQYRVPIIQWIDIWARELTDIRRTMQMNRMHQKIPYILKGPQEKRLDMSNLYKQIAGGEPAIITTTGVETIDVDVLNTKVQFLGEELQACLQNEWNEVYAGLGIPNLPFKAERQIEDEVKSQSAPTSLMALNPMDARRQAADTLVRKFPDAFPDGLDIVWNQDNRSDNYNYYANITEQEDEDGNDTAIPQEPVE